MSEDKNARGIALNEREFAQGGLLVASILGGFVFTAMVLVLQSQATVAASLAENLPKVVFGITSADVYFLVVYVGFGGLSFLCLIVSLVFAVVASAENIDSVSGLFRFAWRALLGISGAFGAMISWLVLGFNPIGGTVLLWADIVIWFWVVRPIWRRAELRDLKSRTQTKK